MLKTQNPNQTILFNLGIQKNKYLQIDNDKKNELCINCRLSIENINKLKQYTIADYINDIEHYGLEKTWDLICRFVLQNGENKDFLNINNFGEMYEIGLALQNKQEKKNRGQYYTPNDVASVMSEWLNKQEGENVCDVGCGTGNLILSYLNFIGFKKARNLLENGNIYLYDFDRTALNICKTSLLLKYGIDLDNKINDRCVDFLNKNVKLPTNCKVISNPPYSTILEYGTNWNLTEIMKRTNELYASFMEKIINESMSAVIISPFSFISGKKYFALRKLLNKKSGFIVSFDNVPGNIFCGRKHGIFNTNISNSVRAAITVMANKGKKGFRVSPLIRFKNIERKQLLRCDILEEFLPKHYQLVTDDNPMFYKCDKRLEHIMSKWEEVSQGHKLKELIDNDGIYQIFIPNTCRYNTTASIKNIKRCGQITLNFDDKQIMNFVFCLINSSFAYWFWRLYDGGITYPKGLLIDIPVFYDKCNENDLKFFEQMTNEMSSCVNNYIVTKNNVGVQENIKYPKMYRDKINEKILNIFRIKEDFRLFDILHSNMAMEVNAL